MIVVQVTPLTCLDHSSRKQLLLLLQRQNLMEMQLLLCKGGVTLMTWKSEITEKAQIHQEICQLLAGVVFQIVSNCRV